MRISSFKIIRVSYFVQRRSEKLSEIKIKKDVQNNCKCQDSVDGRGKRYKRHKSAINVNGTEDC